MNYKKWIPYSQTLKSFYTMKNSYSCTKIMISKSKSFRKRYKILDWSHIRAKTDNSNLEERLTVGKIFFFTSWRDLYLSLNRLVKAVTKVATRFDPQGSRQEPDKDHPQQPVQFLRVRGNYEEKKLQTLFKKESFLLSTTSGRWNAQRWPFLVDDSFGWICNTLGYGLLVQWHDKSDTESQPSY